MVVKNGRRDSFSGEGETFLRSSMVIIAHKWWIFYGLLCDCNKTGDFFIRRTWADVKLVATVFAQFKVAIELSIVSHIFSQTSLFFSCEVRIAQRERKRRRETRPTLNVYEH
jgi:hypothetical protein